MSVRKSVILICLLVSASFGQEVFVRVADTGVALCCVVRMPGNHYMVYDAGNWTGDGGLAFSKVQEVIPPNEDIELMVLSHSDGDHLGAVDEICDAYHVRRVLRSGSANQRHLGESYFERAAGRGNRGLHRYLPRQR